MKSKLIVACAGSGKTTTIIKETLNIPNNQKILITSFTDENCAEIKRKFFSQKGYVPANVDIIPWFTFEIRHLINPYLLPIIGSDIKGVTMVPNQSAKFVPHTSKKCYIDDKNRIYSDKIALLAYKTITETEHNRVVERLKKLYSKIYIDEFQDLVGYDLEIVKILMKNGIYFLLVGDPRQKTFSTHYALKNSQYSNNQESFIKHYCSDLCDMDYTSLNLSLRCPEDIIVFASTLFPQYPTSHSKVKAEDGDGLYLIDESQKNDFLFKENNVVQLRFNAKTQVNSHYRVLTFGKCKGATFENVLIYPTADIKKAILSEDFSKIKSPTTLSKMYVALTRARHKVGIVVSSKDISKNKSDRFKLWN